LVSILSSAGAAVRRPEVAGTGVPSPATLTAWSTAALHSTWKRPD